MVEQKKPADAELIFAAGILAGSIDHLKAPVLRDPIERVVQWLISLVAVEETEDVTPPHDLENAVGKGDYL